MGLSVYYFASFISLSLPPFDPSDLPHLIHHFCLILLHQFLMPPDPGSLKVVMSYVDSLIQL